MLVKGTDPTFQLKTRVTTIGKIFPSPYLTTLFLSLNLASALTTKQLYSVSILFQQFVTKSMEEILPLIEDLGSMYEDDLVSVNSLSSEFHSWYIKWKQQEQEHCKASLPTTLSSTLPQASFFFPNIKVLLLILCTLPVTSCSAERSVSGLKRIKTFLRSTMANERLFSLALLHVQRDRY